MLPLPHTAAISPKTGDDSTGQPTYGAAVNYKCRFELDKIFRRSDDGQTVICDAAIIISSSVAVGEGDQVTVTEFSFTGTVIEYAPFTDVSGKSHHKELFLKTK
jgi:hypothetical protein